MRIKYGNNFKSIDITYICLQKLKISNTIIIPKGDNIRAKYFTDPLPGIHKKIIIENDGNTIEYDENKLVKINVLHNILDRKKRIKFLKNKIYDKIKLINIHSKLKLKYGNFYQELPEQIITIRYLKPYNKVLEIGGNIGRNSLIIASIIQNNHFLTLETDEKLAAQLEENRDLNNFNFFIENSALSKRKLIQKGWETIPSETLKPGYKWVNTITLEKLKEKYRIDFDTLILDCEGALYYILKDIPDILNNINLIIMENDYYDISHKNYVDKVLKQNNFNCDYKEKGGWGPCQNNFYEVWIRNN